MWRAIGRIFAKLFLIILMLGAMAGGAWLGTKVGIKLLEKYKPPTAPKSLVEPVSKRYEEEGLKKVLNAFKKLEENRKWVLPLVILPDDLENTSAILENGVLAMKQEGPMFKMKPPKKIEKKKPEKEKKQEKEAGVKEKGKSKEVKPSKNLKPATPQSTNKKTRRPRQERRATLYYIQIGAYSMRDNAKYVSDELRAIGISNVRIVEERKMNLRLYRVLVGPYRSRLEAERIVSKLNSSGYTGYIIKR